MLKKIAIQVVNNMLLQDMMVASISEKLFPMMEEKF